MPGTLVGMSPSTVAIADETSTLGSKVSKWVGPPCWNRKMTDLPVTGADDVAAAERVPNIGSDMPPSARLPICINSRLPIGRLRDEWSQWSKLGALPADQMRPDIHGEFCDVEWLEVHRAEFVPILTGALTETREETLRLCDTLTLDGAVLSLRRALEALPAKDLVEELLSVDTAEFHGRGLGEALALQDHLSECVGEGGARDVEAMEPDSSAGEGR